MVESMVKDYCHIIEENHHLNEELQHCDEVARENFDLIAQLEVELREKNADNNASNSNAPNVDCQKEIQILQAQLEERDKMIEELLMKTCVQQPSELSVDEIPMDLADASQKLRNTIKDLEAISGDVEEAFDRKDKQLQEQQRTIDELRKQLESPPEQPANESELINMSKFNEIEEHNHILANQTMMLEEQLAALMDEHNKLMETNNDLIKSIIVCQTEICKYDFE